MAEVGFFPKYDQKENKVTNYTLLVLKQIYNESPNLFQEFIVDLIADESSDINIGVSFTQQESFKCEKGKSIIDGVIRQFPFEIFIETKMTDWFYENQLERHLENLSNSDIHGQKVFIALANFDGMANEHKLFEEIKKKYNGKNNLIIVNIEFEDFYNALENLKSKVKSEILSILIDEYEQFLSENDLLPTWKYRLDVVNCAMSKPDVIKNMLYCCPEPKGAYKHLRSKYFGIYENKKVDYIAEIKAVCIYDSNAEENITISWLDNKYNEEDILKEAKEKSQTFGNGIVQMFLLTYFKENINFYKDTKGGLFGSKKYFIFDKPLENINDLENRIKDKPWSRF